MKSWLVQRDSLSWVCLLRTWSIFQHLAGSAFWFGFVSACGRVERIEAMAPPSKMDHAHLLDDVFHMVARKWPEAFFFAAPKWNVSRQTVFWLEPCLRVSLIHAGHRLAVSHHWSVDEGAHYSGGQVQLWTQCNHRVVCQRSGGISADQRGDGHETGGQQRPCQNHPGLLMIEFSTVFGDTQRYDQTSFFFCVRSPGFHCVRFRRRRGAHIDMATTWTQSCWNAAHLPIARRCFQEGTSADVSGIEQILSRSGSCWRLASSHAEWSEAAPDRCAWRWFFFFSEQSLQSIWVLPSQSFLLLRIRSCLTSAISKLLGTYCLDALLRRIPLWPWT